jgi:4-amino-4-deoxy-L-arabinose transferase-like glycosyltransferase
VQLSSLKTWLNWLKGGLSDRWRLALLVFLLAYALFLVFGVGGMRGLSNMSIQWDEVTHLNGGVLLLRGDAETYFSLNAFYPPMYDLVTVGFFGVGGISVFTGRFVSVVFSLLSVYAVFEFTRRIYGVKTALVASVLLAIMPGYVWLSRVALIETMLVFFFTVSALFFFLWLREDKTLFLLLSGLTFGLGVLTKYQTIVLAAVMLTSLVVLGRGYLRKKFRKIPLLIIIALLVIVPWVLVSYQIYASKMLEQWFYALNTGNPDKALYSTGLGRFPEWYDASPIWLRVPVFYLLEMAMPYFQSYPGPSPIHPISIVLYGVGLTGLVLLAWRRKPADKYLLVWFFVVYVFFTAIPNREWRYMMPVFPVLALSAATLVISALRKAQKTWRNPQLSINKKRVVQVAAVALAVFALFGTLYSAVDAVSWVAYDDQRTLPLGDVTAYVAERLKPGENVMVLMPFNMFSEGMVQFYFYSYPSVTAHVYQYPEKPVDTYTPDFNVTELTVLCQQNNVKYALVDEYGGADFHYFNTNLSFGDVNASLTSSGRFTLDPVSFWQEPARVFVFTFS